MAKTVSNVSLYVADLLLAASGACIAWIIWRHLQYLQIDLPGHLASAISYSRVGFHGFNDTYFLGYIHDLFYPPAEDFILSWLQRAAGDPVLGYKIYLSALMAFYLVSVRVLARHIPTRGMRAFFLVCFAAYLHIGRKDLPYVQGLSFMDLWRTGLSSEFLGMGFFALSLSEWLGRRRVPLLSALFSLLILSHIVIALAWGLWMLCELVCLRSRRERYFAVAGMVGAVALSAFWLLPMLWHHRYLTSAIFADYARAAVNPFVLSWVTLLLNRRTPGRWRSMILTAAVILSLPVVAQLFVDHKLGFPAFHYYRLDVLGYFFLCLGLALLVSERFAKETLIPILSFIVLIFMSFQFQKYDWSSPLLTPGFMDAGSNAAYELPRYGRFWVINDERTVDFGIDSLLAIQNAGFKTVKGLYWESTRNNLLLSSYLTTLLSPPIVLEYYRIWGFKCDVHRCLLDHFIRDYNIGGLIVDPSLAIADLPPARQECWRQILADGGTSQFALKLKEPLLAGSAQYNAYEVSPRPGSKFSNDAVTAVSPSQVHFIDLSRSKTFGEPIQDAYQSCGASGISQAVYVQDQEKERMAPILAQMIAHPRGTGSVTAADFRLISPGKFEIKLPEGGRTLFDIKLDYFPGFVLLDSQGAQLPLFEGYPHMLGIGSGKMTLEYRRPVIFLMAYLLSGVTFLIGVLMLVFRKTRLF